MCKCRDEVNKKLAEYGGELTIDLLGSPGVFLSVEKIGRTRGRKPPLVQASYCPFCGKKYPSRGSILARDIGAPGTVSTTRLP